MTSLEPIPDSALKRLGGELAQLLDDDQWNNTEKRYLLPALEEQDSLRAKLQAAEELNQSLTNDLRDACHVGLGQSAVLKNWRSRAEAAEARIVELETAVLNWYEWSTNDSNNDAPLDTINEIALLMLDQEPKVNP